MWRRGFFPLVAVWVWVVPAGAGLYSWSSSWIEQESPEPGNPALLNKAGMWSSVVVDLAGSAHISYSRENDLSLRYAWQSGGLWQYGPLAGGASGSYSKLLVDSAGLVHAVYADATDNLLKHSVRAGGGWGPAEVLGDCQGIEALSAALDAAGQPRVAWVKLVTGSGPDTGDLYYTYSKGGSWKTVTVDTGVWSNTTVYTNSFLDLDGAGRPHISYFSTADAGKLFYATSVSDDPDSDGWVLSPIDVIGAVAGPESSLAVDSLGSPHVAYFYPTDGALHYASWTGSDWAKEIVDPLEGQGLSLALDTADLPRISYLGFEPGMDWVAYAAGLGGSWSIETAYLQSPSGTHILGAFGGTSLALDSSGRPHISLADARAIEFDSGDKDLLYVFAAGGGAIPEPATAAVVIVAAAFARRRPRAHRVC